MRLFYIVFVFLIVTPLHAQRITTRGYGEADLDALLRSTIAASPLIITRDTLIGARDTVRANVLVLKTRFIVEGTILGDVTGVEANMYLRPNARVAGRVMNVSGGYYPSELANVGSVEDRPLAPYHVVRDADGWIIQGTVTRPALKLTGGVQLPEYNRVDGLRAEVGPSFLLPPVAGVEPTISGSIGYATEREEVLGRAQLGLKRGRSTLTFGWEDDITRTNEQWIRSDLKNSISVIWNGKDYRDYYEADRVFLEFRRVLEKGTRTSEYFIRGQNELAHPLISGDPFSVLAPDSVRPNLFVARSRVTSAFVGAKSEWTGLTSVWKIAGTLEFAAKLLKADEAYNAYAASAVYAMKAIANHTLEIEANFRGPLPGTETLPLQRWTFVGGSGTLYTHQIAQFRGHRLAFIETEYTIPFARQLKLPILGQPKLKLMHNIGMAWAYQQDNPFEQNVGARLQFAVAYIRYVIDPGEGGESKFSAGVTLPSKGYPWEKSARTFKP